ncbi:MAG: GTP 3',8-cyclase MoaA [Planctomycetota bacterium]|nr:MAG: GTP 3',8-cyclase MoaA [Planctomycetota bacterium]
MIVRDTLDRPLANLRLSVTDRCNLRCAYCMPEPEYVWLPQPDLLSFEEIAKLVDVFASLGVDRVRLTGGEPLLRRDLDRLVALLAAKPALRDIALTTNGVLLAEQAAPLARAGLKRFTISLDTLRADVFRELTRRDDLARVIAGIDAAAATGLPDLKLDCVVLRGTNDGELADLVAFARERRAEIRFIEYMDVGGATRWSMDRVVSRAEMLARIGRAFGPAEPLPSDGSAPAERWRLADDTTFGIIASTTAPFCASCDRARLTADGHWLTCLYAPAGLDLRTPLRAGASADELARLLRARWTARTDRGAEERLAAARRSALAQPDELRADPHLEMHTRGG